MKKKIIGISGSLIKGEDFIRDYVSRYYSICVEDTGGIPIILPITGDINVIESYVDIIDALILTGGHDIDPKYYNEELLKKGGVPLKIRDSFDMNLLKSAIKKKIPILGICRGMQLINVYFGGSLYQDLKYHDKVTLKHWQDDSHEDPVHKVFLSKDSVLNRCFKDEVWVNSLHHQTIKDIGEGLVVGGLSSDKCVEVIEKIDEEHFILGLQWHPEIMYANKSKDMKGVFQLFFNEIK